MGAQQSLVLPDPNSLEILSFGALDEMRRTLIRSDARFDQSSRLMTFVWQLPVMVLGYSVFTYLAGLCAVVLSPFAAETAWNDETKVSEIFGIGIALTLWQSAVLFICASALCLLFWILGALYVHKLNPAG